MIAPVKATRRSAAEIAEAKLWRAYQRKPTVERRNALVEFYMPLVNRLASSLVYRLCGRVDRGDLISAGVFGLIQSIDGFDKSRGSKFETFARLRVRGAMLDSVRDFDPASRLVRTQMKAIDATRELLAHELEREPTLFEIAERMNVDPKEIDDVMVAAENANPASLDEALFYDGEESSCEKSREYFIGLEDPGFAVAEKWDEIDRLMRGLSRREREVLFTYYVDDETMKEAGARIGVCESYVSQVMPRLLAHCRANAHAN